jgi:regulator of protease activity HflC (stomatin/prohibitin superfamily)
MAQMREAIARGLEEAMKTMTAAGLSTEQAMQFLSDTNRLDTITSAAAHGNTIIIDAGQSRDLAGMAAILDSIKK